MKTFKFSLGNGKAMREIKIYEGEKLEEIIVRVIKELNLDLSQKKRLEVRL